MLSIAKLRDAEYYLGQVATGAEDYYLGAGEAPGRWAGSACADLGLAGEVTKGALAAVLAGRDPRDERALVAGKAAAQGRRPGFDLVLSAPKGVSVLGALGPPEVQAAARAAHDQAVAEAVAWLEEMASWCRRGRDGAQRMSSTGYVAAAFRHRTSRAAEPQLHTHLVVANLALGADGRWSALDARALYAQARTAGFIYQACLRAQLTERLGLAWAPVAQGMAEPAGMAPGALAAFSTRRAQIEAALAAHGGGSARAAQVAAWATRAPKAALSAEGAAALARAWADKATQVGLGPEVLACLVGPPREAGLSPGALATLAEELVGPEGLTAHAGAFERRDLMRALAQACPDGAHLGQLQALADQVLARPEVVAVGPSPTGEARWSTAELLALEQAVVRSALARRPGQGQQGPEGSEAVLGAVLGQRPQLSGEQVAMVRALVGSGAGVQVVVGKAGTGKTTALEAARAAWVAQGRVVVGAALAARAAAELEAGSGIASTSLARLLAELARPEGRLGPKDVVVVDEAAMVGTRDLARLLDLAGPARVVLVGDPRQLPEVGAGGSFAALAERLPVIELTENRRQSEVWERAALDELRHGQVAAAISAYGGHGRVTLAESPQAARAAMVADWWAHRRAQPESSGLMVALRRGDVEALNVAAHKILVEAGALGPGGLVVAGRQFCVGDEVVALRNDARLGITNGTRARVVGIDEPHFALTLRTGDQAVVRLPRSYLEAGHLALGYALTLHKAQGATVERAFLLGTEALYREAGYVGLSRARQRCDLYALAGAEGPAGPEDPLAALVRSLAGSRAQAQAGAAGPPSLARLGPERDALAACLLAGVPPDPARRLEALEADLARVGTDAAAAGPAWAARERERLEAERARLVAEGHHRQAWLGAQDQRLERVAELDRAMGARRALLGQAALADPPEAVTTALGPPPDGLAGRRAWRAGAEAVLAYRERWGVESPEPLGPPGRERASQVEQARAERELARAARRLGRELDHGMEVGA